MSSFHSILTRWAFRLVVPLAVLAGGLASCSTIWDNDDCPATYRVQFRYDYNMAFADAFSAQVHSVTLYAFGADGKLAFTRSESGDALTAEGYSMELPVPPGQYDLVAWAGVADGDGFALPQLTVGVSTLDDLKCRINRHSHENCMRQPVDSVGRLQPVWNGHVEAQPLTRGSSFPDTEYITVPLVKDTHTFRVILQQMAEGEMEASRFEVSVADRNGLMAADNSLLPGDGVLTSMAYYQTDGSAGTSGADGERLNVAVYELTTGRLMADSRARLTVTDRRDGRAVLSIPLVQYLELCRTVANYRMPLQEYLDREDTYSMTFFLDANQAWINTQVIINDWIVRYNDINP